MLKLRDVVLAGAVCVGLSTAASAVTDTKAAAMPQRVAPPPLVKLTPATASAARAAAAARVAPVVQANLPSLSVQQIVDRNTVARGGLSAWQRVDTMTLAGKLDAGKVRVDGGQVAIVSKQERALARAKLRKSLAQGTLEADAQPVIQLPFQMDLKRPVKTRLEIPFQGETAVQVYDGAAGWKLRPFLGRHEVEPFSPEEMKIASSQQPLDGPLINHAAKGTTVELDGAEMVDGRGAYKLKLTLKNGEVRHLWIDGQTFLDVKIDGAPRRVDGKWRQVVTYFRDYKPVEGLLIAHRLDTAVESIPGVERIFIEKVALNPPLNETRFARPQ